MMNALVSIAFMGLSLPELGTPKEELQRLGFVEIYSDAQPWGVSQMFKKYARSRPLGRVAMRAGATEKGLQTIIRDRWVRVSL
jgi:hypothetical protein